MKNRFLIQILPLFITLASSQAWAERIAIYNKHAEGTIAFVKQLKQVKTKLDRLLAMRSEVDGWERKLIAREKVLHKEKNDQKEDLKKVEAGTMSKAAYQAKWIKSGRAAKVDANIKRFLVEIKKYNQFRLRYNLLAQELAKHLQRRNPNEVRSLLKKMESLIRDMQQAIRSEDFAKADKIAKASKLAAEFGYSNTQ